MRKGQFSTARDGPRTEQTVPIHESHRNRTVHLCRCRSPDRQCSAESTGSLSPLVFPQRAALFADTCPHLHLHLPSPPKKKNPGPLSAGLPGLEDGGWKQHKKEARVRRATPIRFGAGGNGPGRVQTLIANKFASVSEIESPTTCAARVLGLQALPAPVPTSSLRAGSAMDRVPWRRMMQSLIPLQCGRLLVKRQSGGVLERDRVHYYVGSAGHGGGALDRAPGPCHPSLVT